MTARAVEGLVEKWERRAANIQAHDDYNAARCNTYEQCADQLREALAADRAEAGELPELPAPAGNAYIVRGDDRQNDYTYDEPVYTADQLRAYGQQCARAAISKAQGAQDAKG